MNYGSYRFWAMINALLALGILLLLFCLLLMRERRHEPEYPANVRVMSGMPPAFSFAVHHEMEMRRTGTREVCFAPSPAMPDAASDWRLNGMHPQEWARLPASPGMDMVERPDAYLLAFSLPGVRDEDIRFSITDLVVSVQAVVRDLAGNPVGGVARHVYLPRALGSPVEFSTRFSNGVLRVCVAK